MLPSLGVFWEYSNIYTRSDFLLFLCFAFLLYSSPSLSPSLYFPMINGWPLCPQDQHNSGAQTEIRKKDILFQPYELKNKRKERKKKENILISQRELSLCLWEASVGQPQPAPTSNLGTVPEVPRRTCRYLCMTILHCAQHCVECTLH